MGNQFDIYKFVETIFFIIISICTIYNLAVTRNQARLLKKQTEILQTQTDLLHKPVLGVTNTKTIKYLDKGKADTYDNINQVKIDFEITNVGNQAAKDCKIKITGKLGNTTLPYTEREGQKGVTLIPDIKVHGSFVLNKSYIDRFVQKKERLILRAELSYSDLDDINHYIHIGEHEVNLIKQNPLILNTNYLSGEINKVNVEKSKT